MDYPKIDRSFMDGLGRGPEGAAIVSAMVGFSRDLDSKVVADDIGTADQLEELKGTDCEPG